MNMIDEMQGEIFDFAYELVHKKIKALDKELLKIYEDDKDTAEEIYYKIHRSLLKKIIPTTACACSAFPRSYTTHK